MSDSRNFLHRIELSAVLTIIGVILLFASAVVVTLIAPNFVDPSWQEASSAYQVQMYEVSDPNVYISTSNPGRAGLQYVYHLKENFTLLAFNESEWIRILAPPELERFVTRTGEPFLKLTSKVLLLREPKESLAKQEDELQKRLQAAWQKERHEEKEFPRFQILELYDPQKREAFAITETDGVVENWVDAKYEILDDSPKHSYHQGQGVIYVKNPKEYRVREFDFLGKRYWLYDENGGPLNDLKELKSGNTQFLSRGELIRMGEDIYRIEGCWYCHTDQTRTLVQDTVLNGSALYPAPPSSANEYIYQRVTFPGTRRIGPDLSRVGVKRANRDWHQSHFWFPRSESKGTVMPSFRHFFDADPSGVVKSVYGLPNYRFEAIFNYLMTKGTRITPPTQAWWLGKDPIQTIDIIERRK